MSIDLHIDLGDIGQREVTVDTWRHNEHAIISVKCNLGGVPVELLPLLTKDALAGLQDAVDCHYLRDDGDLADHMRNYQQQKHLEAA